MEKTPIIVGNVDKTYVTPSLSDYVRNQDWYHTPKCLLSKNAVNTDAFKRFQNLRYKADVPLFGQNASMLWCNSINIQLFYLCHRMLKRFFTGHNTFMKGDYVWERAINISIWTVLIIIAAKALLFELKK